MEAAHYCCSARQGHAARRSCNASGIQSRSAVASKTEGWWMKHYPTCNSGRVTEKTRKSRNTLMPSCPAWGQDTIHSFIEPLLPIRAFGPRAYMYVLKRTGRRNTRAWAWMHKTTTSTSSHHITSHHRYRPLPQTATAITQAARGNTMSTRNHTRLLATILPLTA